MKLRDLQLRFVSLCLVLAGGFAATTVAQSTAPPAGKMWLFEELPREYLKATYGFEPSQEWLDEVRLAALRFDGLGTASFVSPRGLILTNHHCVRGRLERMEHEGENLNDNGYVARALADELPLTGAVASQLVSMQDVTDRVFAGVDLTMPYEDVERAIQANRQAVMAEARRQHPDLMPELQTFYRGARVHLYLYKNYTDLRLVFAPHLTAGFFGGNADNFSYPHYGVDFALVRAYEDGRPADTSAHHFRWSTEPMVEGEPVFSAGFPGSTDRHKTVAELECERDSTLAINAAATVSMWHALESYLDAHPEAREKWGDTEFNIANTGKSLQGQVGALHDPARLKKERALEEELRARVAEDPVLDEAVGFAWDEIASAAEELEGVNDRFWYQSPGYTAGRRFGPLARAVYVVEAVSPESTEEAQAQARERALSYPGSVDELDPELFADHLERARKILGADDPAVKAMLTGRSPVEAVQHLLDDSRIRDVSFVQELLDGGWEVVSASVDPAIVAARVIQPLMAANLEEKALLEGVIAHQALLVGKAIDAVYGPEVCPEASFGLRLSDGIISGYDQLSTRQPAWTNFYGMYGRCAAFGDRGDFDLPDLWLERVDDVDLATPLDFVATLDLIGGSSGSAVVNRDRRLVGLVFDGNLQMVENDFLYTDEQARGICVASDGILETLRAVYQVPALVDELLGEGGYQ